MIIGGVIRSHDPRWAKVSEILLAVAIASGGTVLSATFGSDRRRFVVALVLVVVAEWVAYNVFVNAACFLGGCGD